MKTELYQSNVKIQALSINLVPAQVAFIKPRRACAERVTVVVLCVCVCVCLSAHANLAVRAIKSVMKDRCVKRQICSNIIMAFFFCLIRKLEHLLLTSAGAAIFS